MRRGVYSALSKAGLPFLFDLCAQSRQRLALGAGRVEVVRCQPRLKCRPPDRPIPVGHPKPGGIPVAVLDDHVLAKHTLVDKTEPLRGPTRRSVERVALPLEPAVAETVERVPGRDEDRLGRLPRALQDWGEPDVTD